MNFIKKISDLYLTILKYFLEIVFGGMVLLVFAQVVARFLFNRPFGWSDELACHMQTIILFAGLAYCVYKKSHTEMVMFYNLMPSWGQILCSIVGNAIMLYCMIVFTQASFTFMQQQHVPSPSMDWLMLHWIYSIIPFGSITCCLYIAGDLIRSICRLFKKGEHKSC
ncbi:MAG: TRAP transporter small permease [Eubacteriales bacterium]